MLIKGITEGEGKGEDSKLFVDYLIEHQLVYLMIMNFKLFDKYSQLDT